MENQISESNTQFLYKALTTKIYLSKNLKINT